MPPIEPCEMPAVTNPNATGLADACMVTCPANRPFNEELRACEPYPKNSNSCEAQVGNPISFITGEKYLVQADYQGRGAFPLAFVHFYNSHANRAYSGRSGWSVDPEVMQIALAANDTAVLNTYGDSGAQVVHYEPTVPVNEQKRYSALIDSPPYTDSNEDQYIGHVQDKWKHSYDKLLVASFNYQSPDANDTPSNLQLHNPDGNVEYYVYDANNGRYQSRNGYSSYIKRLDNSHELAPGWQVNKSSGEIEIYDLDGRFLRVSSPAGLSLQLLYDAAGSRLERVEDDFGRGLSFFYDDPGNPDKITRFLDPDGNEYLYSYNSRGLLTRISYPDQTSGSSSDNPNRVFHYEDSRFPDALTGITNENGERYTTYAYDSYGRAVSTELAGGVERTTVAYDDVANTSTLANAFGLQTSLHLNGKGLIVEVGGSQSPAGLCPAANYQFHGYNAEGRKTSTTDWNGNVTVYEYNDRGLETRRVEAEGTGNQRLTTTSWHSEYPLPLEISSGNKTVAFTYDGVGRLLSISESDATAAGAPRITSMTYNAAGLISAVDGPRIEVSDITTYDYDAQGNQIKITNALGQETNITSHDAHGLPLTIVDPNGTVTSLVYDARMRLLSQTVDGQTTSFSYDGAGNIVQTTLPNGSYLINTYDAAQRLVDIEDNLGNTVTYTLDGMGNRVQEEVRDAAGVLRQTLARTYNNLNRLVQTVGGAGQTTTLSYDLNGNLTQTLLDPGGLNQSTAYAFDALNRLMTITDAGNGVTSYSYDARDNLLAVTDPKGNTTTYVYDGLDNLIQQSSPDTGTTTFTQDDAGNVLTRTDARGVVTQYTYDALNRLTHVHYPASPEEGIVYQYDQTSGGFGIGRLTRQQDQSGITQWVYDRRGNVVQESVTIQGNTYITQYAYDPADVLVQTIYPSGRIVNHQLDATGRTAAATTQRDAGAASVTLVSDIAYLPFGPVQEYRQGNGLLTGMSYDLDYRLTGLSTSDGGTGNPAILGLSYSHDAANNILGILNSLDSSRSQSFAYDPLHRLTSASGGYGSQLFGYDQVGNRLYSDITRNGVNTLQNYTYDPGSNRLLNVDDGVSVRTFQYDAVGNVIGDDRGAEPDRALQYNGQNRLIEVAPVEVQP